MMEKSPIQIAPPEKTVPVRFFSDKEEDFIKSVFSGEQGEKNLKVLRKALLPAWDANGQIGVAVDVWSDQNYANMLPDQQAQAILSRIHFITNVEKTLLMLKSVANRVDETEEQKGERLRKNSTR